MENISLSAELGLSSIMNSIRVFIFYVASILNILIAGLILFGYKYFDYHENQKKWIYRLLIAILILNMTSILIYKIAGEIGTWDQVTELR